MFPILTRLLEKTIHSMSILLLPAALMLTPSVVLAFGIGLTPTTIEMSVKPAQTRRQVIRVVNINQHKSLAMTVGVADWTLDQHGKLRLSPPGSSGESASRWLRFSPASFTLKPGEGKQILVDIAVPAKVPHGGDYKAALLVSTLLPPRDERKARSGIWNRHQVASLFYFTLPPAKSLPVVEDAMLRPGPAGKKVLRLNIRNDGNAHARIRGRVSVIDSNGKTTLSQEVNGVALAGQRLLLDTAIDTKKLKLPPGGYRLSLDLNNTHAPQASGGEMPLPVDTPLPSLRIP